MAKRRRSSEEVIDLLNQYQDLLDKGHTHSECRKKLKIETPTWFYSARIVNPDFRDFKKPVPLACKTLLDPFTPPASDHLSNKRLELFKGSLELYKGNVILGSPKEIQEQSLNLVNYFAGLL